MKEATGELNMTVVTVIAIAAIATIFATLVWPAIKRNIEKNTNCANAICGACVTESKTAVCYYIAEDGKTSTEITCPCNP